VERGEVRGEKKEGKREEERGKLEEVRKEALRCCSIFKPSLVTQQIS
jgi:hypothetical protein